MNAALPTGNAALVFRRAAALMGQPWSAIDSETFSMLSSFFGARLETLWEVAEWPELSRPERRLVVFPWVYGQAYNVGDVRYHHGTNQQHQVVDPAGVTGSEEPGTSPKWVEIARDYEAAAFDIDTVYRYGDLAFWADGEQTYCYIGNSALAGVLPTNGSHWTLMVKGYGDFPLVDVQGDLDEMGTVFKVTLDDPDRYDTEAAPVVHRVTATGIRVQGDPGSAWFRYREPVPSIFGDQWDVGTAYEVGNQVYYEAAGVGHFYNALSDNTGAQPDTEAEDWEQVRWPKKFESAIALGLYADWLRLDGQTEKSERAEGKAFDEETRLLEVLVRQQKQYARTTVQTR